VSRKRATGRMLSREPAPRRPAARLLPAGRSDLTSVTGPTILLVLLICVWGVSWPVIKIGVGSIPPIWFGCLRYLIAAAMLLGFVWRKDLLFLPRGRDWSVVLVSASTQMAGFSALTGFALTTLPAGRASVLAYSTPIFVVPLAAWRVKERARATALLGVAVGLIGIIAIASPSLQFGRRDQMLGYSLLVLAAALWAISIVHVHASRFSATPLELAPWQMIIAGLMLLPIAFVVEGPLRSVNLKGIAALAYVGPIATAFAYWAMVEVARLFPPTLVSTTLLAVPCLGIAFSELMLKEAIDSSLVVGILLIVLGIGLARASQ